MKFRGLKEIMQRNVEGNALALATLIVFPAGGSLLSFVGYGVGVLFALQFGLPAPFEYGGAPGYEGAALFGGMCGSALFTFILIAIWLRGRAILGRAMIAYLVLWIFDVLAMHYAVIATGSTVFGLLPLPAIVIGIAVSAALYSSESAPSNG